MSHRQARRIEQAGESDGSDMDAEELAKQALDLAKADRKPAKASGFAAMMM